MNDVQRLWWGARRWLARRLVRGQGLVLLPEGPPPAPVRQHFLYHYSADFDAEALLHRLQDPDRAAQEGLLVNFLGVRIDASPLPEILSPRLGTLEPIPDPGNWHADIAEWAATLRSIEAAGPSYRMIEVGCGWGCWIINLGATAKRLGKAVDLVGIEGSHHHLENARRLLTLNGVDAAEARLVHGVAAPKNDRALFPLASATGYGAEPVFFPTEDEAAALMATGEYEDLATHTLESLADGRRVDLLHIDIQGSELSFVEGNWDDISRYVKRVFIGTHGRALDGALIEAFSQRGWVLEVERPSLEVVENGQMSLRIDGVQLWCNPGLE